MTIFVAPKYYKFFQKALPEIYVKESELFMIDDDRRVHIWHYGGRLVDFPAYVDTSETEGTEDV